MTPVLLHHGLFGFGNFRLGPIPVRYFAGGIERAIADLRHPLILGRSHPTGSIEERARQLKERTLSQLKTLGQTRDRIVILAHSMGGLDARFMVSHLGMAERVAAVVTICTPHRGSSYAGWVVENLGDRLGGARLVKTLGINLRALADLTPASMQQFNAQTPDAPGVRYFSIAGLCKSAKLAPFFLPAYRVVFKHEGENDGVVSLSSAKWGEFLGAWPVDHMHAINKRFTPEALLPRNDVTPRYAALLANLRIRQVL